MNDGANRLIAGVYLLLHSEPAGSTGSPDTRHKNKNKNEKRSRLIHRVMRWITSRTGSRAVTVEREGESKNVVIVKEEVNYGK